jgi:hypothetical protein
MRVAQVIEMLSKMDPNAEVKAFDADELAMVPVTGAVHGGNEVELQTDSDTCSHPGCWGPCAKCGAHVHESLHGRFCPNCGSV